MVFQFTGQLTSVPSDFSWLGQLTSGYSYIRDFLTKQNPIWRLNETLNEQFKLTL